MKHIIINSLCHLIVLDESTSIVFGSPPEWIKRASGFPFPRHIFLGDTMLYNGYNFSEVEFPIYKNFFFNKLRKTIIVAPEKNIHRLGRILNEALLGPSSYPAGRNGKKAAYFGELLAVRKNFDPREKKLRLDDYAEFSGYAGGTFVINDCTIIQTDRDSFLIRSPSGELAIELGYETAATDKRARSGKKIDGLLSLYCFDSGDGFSNGKECSSFILNCGGKYIIFDPNIFSFDRFIERGYDFRDIQAVFISHLHADHDQGLYRFLRYNSEIPILTGEIVAESLTAKLELMIGDPEFVKKYHIVSLPLQKKNYVDFLDCYIYCDIGFHTIPSVMTKIYFNDRRLRDIVFAYSGDTLYDPPRINDECFPPAYRGELLHFFDDATAIVHEAGAGLIHTDPEDLIPFLSPDQKLFWLHTGRTDADPFSRGHIMEKDETILLR